MKNVLVDLRSIIHAKFEFLGKTRFYKNFQIYWKRFGVHSIETDSLWVYFSLIIRKLVEFSKLFLILFFTAIVKSWTNLKINLFLNHNLKEKIVSDPFFVPRWISSPKSWSWEESAMELHLKKIFSRFSSKIR